MSIVLDAGLNTKNTMKKNSLCFNELLCIVLDAGLDTKNTMKKNSPCFNEFLTISHTCQGTATPERTVEGKSLETSSGKEDCLST